MAKIPIMLEPGRADGKLATSDAIFDKNKNMFQSEINDIQDTLTSDNSNKPLSARQGKILKDLFNSKVIKAGSIPIDTEPIEGNITHLVNSDGLAKEFNKCNTEIVLVGLYDVSAHNNGAMFESLQSLLSSPNLDTLIPTSVRCGGMSIKFIQSSDNKYVQYRLMKNTWSTTVGYWQGVDDELTAGSANVVKSGAVFNYLADNLGYIANPENWTFVGQCSISEERNWNVGDTYESKSFDVVKLRGTKLIVKANDIGNAIISFVKSIGYPNDPIFATGEKGRHLIPVFTSAELTVPADANYAVVTTKNNNDDRTPQIYKEFSRIKTTEQSVCLLNMLLLNMPSTSYIKEIGNYQEYSGKYLDEDGNIADNADYQIIAFCCSKQDTKITITNNNGRTVRVFILNPSTRLTAISSLTDATQTISLYNYNSDYKYNIILVSKPKITSMSVDGTTYTTNITLDSISDTIYRTTLRTILGKAINPTTGEIYDAPDFTLNYFSTVSDTFTVSFSYVQSGRTIRIFALKAGVSLSQIHEVVPSDAVDIDVNFPHFGVVFVVQCHKNNLFTISNLATDDGIGYRVESLENKTKYLDNITGILYNIPLGYINNKALNENGELVDNSLFKIAFFCTTADTFVISFSGLPFDIRNIRLWAFRYGIPEKQIYKIANSSPNIDITINYPHKGTVFYISYRNTATISVTNLSEENGIIKRVETLENVNQKFESKSYLIDTYLNKGRVVYSAHRGLRTVAPENSIPAYEAAGKAGFDFLNLAQLRQSADGTWYVMHDDTIDRTTDGTGMIKDLTDDYLQTVHIDIGTNIEQYTPDELVIPTLEKAIQIARKYGMKLYFRIASITGNSYQADKAAWDSFITIIRKYRCEGMLFGGNALTDLLPLHRDLGLDWCINYDVYSSEAVFQQITDYVNAGIKNATIFTTSEILTDAHIAAAREHGFKVMVHLTSDNSTKAQCLEWSNKGVDIIGGVVNYDLSEE